MSDRSMCQSRILWTGTVYHSVKQFESQTVYAEKQSSLFAGRLWISAHKDERRYTRRVLWTHSHTTNKKRNGVRHKLGRRLQISG